MAEAGNSRVEDQRVPHGDGHRPQLLDLRGSHWRRSLIMWPDGRRDDTSSVDWLQGPTLYIDRRCPSDRPDFAGAQFLDDLDWPAIAWLARQEGFAGRLQFDGDCFVWERLIDFQPRSIAPDVGRLWFEDGVMIEQGRDIPYVEHWHRQNGAGTLCAAVRLREQGQDSEAFIVRLGTTFMYARARAVAAPTGLSLSECVARAPSLADARGLIDCEISIGHAGASGWTITGSTLPFREGQKLVIAAQRGRHRIRSTDISPSGDASTRDWDILEAEGDVTGIVPLVF